MPVKYLMNVSKNNLILPLHVLWHSFGTHCGHVALQGKEMAADVCLFVLTQKVHNTTQLSCSTPYCGNPTSHITKLLLTFRCRELYFKPKYLQLFKAAGDGCLCNIKLLRLIIHKIFLRTGEGGMETDQSVERSEGIVMIRIWRTL